MTVEIKDCPIPIRFDRSTLNRVDLAAKKLGTAKSSLIRMAVCILLDQINSGHIEIGGFQESKKLSGGK
jgi:hypothetical protein